MKGMQILLRIAEENGGIIETKAAVKAGVSRASLSAYNRKGRIRRIALGKYQFVQEEQDILSILEAHAKQSVFSHDTALFLHGIIEKMPEKPSLTIVSGKTPSNEVRPLSKVFFIKKELFELGKTMMTIKEGRTVSVYDLERTIIDMIRSRRRLGEEAVVHSLKAYYNNPHKDMKKILYYAEAFHMGAKFCRYWDAILCEMEKG